MSNTAKPKGRPSELGPDPVTIRVRVPLETAERIDAAAGESSRSEVVRALIEAGLRSLGRR